WKMPIVPGPQTSWVMRTSTFTHTFSSGETWPLPACLARIFSVIVMPGMVAPWGRSRPLRGLWLRLKMSTAKGILNPQESTSIAGLGFGFYVGGTSRTPSQLLFILAVGEGRLLDTRGRAQLCEE